MSSSLEKAILRTLIYSDVFDYPLTLGEIKKWLIGVGMKNKELRIKNIKNIQKKGGHYFLKGREEIIDLRKSREKYSQKKLKIAKEIAALLKLIPTIKLVGITGALAVDNAKKYDDIDLFIITSAGFLWTTRFLSTLLVEVTGNRRHPGENDVNDKICLNMFTDEGHLEVPKKEQDLFSAHEVAQMRLLWERDNAYKKFLAVNQWVKKYLPNAIKSSEYEVVSSKYKGIKENLPEKILKKFQLWYMKNRRTKEVIKEGMIRFHPHDAREWVMSKYEEELKEFNLWK